MTPEKFPASRKPRSQHRDPPRLRRGILGATSYLCKVNAMGGARPLAAPSGFARTLLRLCFAKLLASLVGGPDGFAAGASRAQATRRLPARANDARPRTLRTSRCLVATFGSVAATWLEAMPRQSRHHRRPCGRASAQNTYMPIYAQCASAINLWVPCINCSLHPRRGTRIYTLSMV